MGGKRSKRRTSKNILEDLYDQLRVLHTAWTVILGMGFAVSILLWCCFLIRIDGIKIKVLVVEGIVNGILLASHLYRIFFIGYNDRLWHNFKMTLIPNVVLSLLGFYITGVNLTGAAAQQTELLYIMQFLTNALVAVAMALMPTLLLTLLIWFIVKTIAFFIEP